MLKYRTEKKITEEYYVEVKYSTNSNWKPYVFERFSDPIRFKDMLPCHKYMRGLREDEKSRGFDKTEFRMVEVTRNILPF